VRDRVNAQQVAPCEAYDASHPLRFACDPLEQVGACSEREGVERTKSGIVTRRNGQGTCPAPAFAYLFSDQEWTKQYSEDGRRETHTARRTCERPNNRVKIEEGRLTQRAVRARAPAHVHVKLASLNIVQHRNPLLRCKHPGPNPLHPCIPHRQDEAKVERPDLDVRAKLNLQLQTCAGQGVEGSEREIHWG
jgi:hypothetical protein